MAATAVSTAPIAVMITTGNVGSMRLMSFWTSMPDLPGSMRSRRTASYKFSSIFLRPSSPVAAESVINPSKDSNSSMLSRISSSSSMIRTSPFRLDIHGFPNQRQFQPEGRSDALPAFHRNSPTVLLHDSITDRQAQPCTFTGSLCRKKWIIDLLYVFRADSCAGILHENFDLRIHRFRQNAKLAAFGHCIARIDDQIQEYLLQFPGVAESDGAFCSKLLFDADTAALQLMVKQRKRIGNELVNVDLGEFRGIRPGEIQQAIDDLRGSECLLCNLFKQLVPAVFRTNFLAQHLRIAGNNGQRGVHLMSNAGCQQANRSELLVLNELIFQPDTVGDVVDDDESSSGITDFVEQ